MIASAIWKGILPTETHHKVHWELPDGRPAEVGKSYTQTGTESIKQNDTPTGKYNTADMEDEKQQERKQGGNNQ